ncbi:hypothetical protein N8314_00640 [Akkermansiaceae bacterium]|nr:hypothetical protein [Akkermansiaceae bacterium]
MDKPKGTYSKPKSDKPKNKISVAWRDAKRAIIDNKAKNQQALDQLFPKKKK